MSNTGLKSLCPDLFLDSENGKCGIVRAVRRSLVSATTALSVFERKVALAICDTPSHSGSSSRI